MTITYYQPSRHNPRQRLAGAARRAQPSRAVAAALPSYGPILPTWDEVVGPVRDGSRAAQRAAAAQYARVKQAIADAFPQGAATPRWRGAVATAAGAVAGRAQHYESAYYDTMLAWESFGDVMSALDPVTWGAAGGLGELEYIKTVNPVLEYIQDHQHPWFVKGNYDKLGPFDGNFIWHVDQPGVLNNNNFIVARYRAANYLPGFRSMADDIVPANHYWVRNIDKFHYAVNFWGDQFWMLKGALYRNNQGVSVQGVVELPDLKWAKPLGVPLPIGVAAGYPLAGYPDIAGFPARSRARAAARPLTRPRAVPEYAVVITDTATPPYVYESKPRKPGPKAREKKYYGRGAMPKVAGVAFWAYENVNDWNDWVKIITEAIPSMPHSARKSNASRWAWLAKHPEKIAEADFAMIAYGMGEWLIGEIFGAMIGNINSRGWRSISQSPFTVDMVNNAPLHYAPSGGRSPGAFAMEYVTAFLR